MGTWSAFFSLHLNTIWIKMSRLLIMREMPSGNSPALGFKRLWRCAEVFFRKWEVKLLVWALSVCLLDKTQTEWKRINSLLRRCGCECLAQPCSSLLWRKTHVHGPIQHLLYLIAPLLDSCMSFWWNQAMAGGRGEDEEPNLFSSNQHVHNDPPL